MHLFVVAAGERPPAAAALAAALGHAAERIPSLGDAERWTATSPSGRLQAAGLHHAAARAAPRSYRSVERDGTLTAYDGLPLLEDAAPWDAAALASRWPRLPETLEGACCALRLEAEHDRAELLTDPMGMVPLYHGAFEGGTAVSNSLLALRSVLGRHELDEEAAATVVCLGWALGERTHVRGIAAVGGGTRLRLSPAGLRRDRHFGPETVARGLGRGGTPVPELALRLTGLVASPAGVPVEAALTGGRDSRVCLALLRAAGVDADYFTGGAPGEPDVEVAAALARRFGLRHAVAVPPLHELPPRVLIESFIDQNDGTATLDQLRDHTGQLDAPERIGLTVSGMGGEMVRGGSSLLVAFTANLGPLSEVRRLQHRCVHLKVDTGGGLVRPEAAASARRQASASLERFAAQGWPVHALNEAFYAFERIGVWGSTSARRAAATHDLLAPLTTRAFLEHGMGRRTGERYVEATHRELLGHLDPALRDAPFEFRWRPQQPRLAPAMVSAEAARLVARRLAGRLPRRAPAAPVTDHVRMRASAWQALRREHAAALERAGDDAPVFAVVDRDALRRAVASDAPPDTTVHRALTLVWSLA